MASGWKLSVEVIEQKIEDSLENDEKTLIKFWREQLKYLEKIYTSDKKTIDVQIQKYTLFLNQWLEKITKKEVKQEIKKKGKGKK